MLGASVVELSSASKKQVCGSTFRPAVSVYLESLDT